MFLIAGRLAQPARLAKPAKRFFRFRFRNAQPITMAVGFFFNSVSRPVITITSGFGGEDFFRIDRAVELDRRSGDIVAADQRRHRTPHALAEGNAVFGRAFVAELDIHFRLGQVGFLYARLDGVGDAFVVCRQLSAFCC